MRKMYLVLTALMLCFFLISYRTAAQHNLPQSRIWAMGNKAGLDFTSGTPVPIATELANGNEAAASICSPTGTLLFYTNGTKIWTRTNTLMPKGQALLGAGNTASTLSTTQGAVICPVPGNANRYYVFSLTQVSNCKLYCSVVDMTLNGGLGDVDTTAALYNTLIRSNLTEKMTIFSSGCQNKLWLILHEENTLSFLSYAVTADSVARTPVVSTLGSFPAVNYQQGVIKVSPDHKKLLTCNFRAGTPVYGGLELFNIDSITGQLSSPATLDTLSFYGGTFSANSHRVYGQCNHTPAQGIWQYDLDAAIPRASRLFLGASGQYADMKLGPDSKIYFGALAGGAGYNNYRYMGCVNNPDIAGTGCNFKDSVTTLFFPAATGSSGALAQGLPNDVAIPSASIRTNGTALDTNICGTFPSITVSAASGYGRYEWNDAVTTQTRTITTAGIYQVTMYSGCGIHTDTFKIANTTLPVLSITATSNLLKASAGYSRYSWMLNGTALPDTAATHIATTSGTYTVTGMINGCTATATFTYNAPTAIEGVDHLAYGIYPNPATTVLHIESAVPVSAVVYGLDGRRLSITDAATTINLAALQPGLYFIRLYQKNGREVYHEKLLKK